MFFQIRFIHFEYVVIPLGLCNTLDIFQSILSSVLNKALDKFCTMYLDDILNFSTTPTKYLHHVKWFLNKLQKFFLHTKPTKCELGLTKLEYLAHLITNGTVKPDPRKIKSISNWAPQTKQKEMHLFLGFCKHYGCFVHHFGDFAAPLYIRLYKDQQWK